MKIVGTSQRKIHETNNNSIQKKFEVKIILSIYIVYILYI